MAQFGDLNGFLRRCGLLMLEHVTCFNYRCGIDRDVSFIDVLNDAVFVDQEGSAIAEALLFVEDAIVFDDRAFEIAE